VIKETDTLSHKIESETHWHLAMIPLFMAIGNPGLIVTLVALSRGASVAEVGVIGSIASAASFAFSMIWGRLSDASSQRKVYLLYFMIILAPLFTALSIVNTIPQITLMYTLVVAISSGVTPIGIMYTVECCKGKNWPNQVARFNSIISVGNIIGLLLFTLAAKYVETQPLFIISSFCCLLSAILIMMLGHEPQVSLERQPFYSKILHDIEGIIQPKAIIHTFDIRRLQLPKSLKRLTPIQLLLITAFVHWTGICIYSVGMTPLMKALGLSDSLIFALNVGNSIAAAASFTWLAPRIKAHLSNITRLITIRAILVLCWAPLPFLIGNPPPYVFAIPLLISVTINACYAILWLPLVNLAISQAPEDHKSSVIGQLMSATSIAGALGSALGGFLITGFGYTVGFVVASTIMLISIPIVHRIKVFDSL
jgi:MFS family permease